VANKKHLIVGSGAAGLSALRQIRSLAAEDEIRVVSMEDCLPYSPTALPYLLSGKIGEPKLWTADQDDFKQLKAALVLGKRLVRILPEQKEAVFGKKDKEKYDTLLIATGSEPLFPPIEGMAEGEVVGFHTLKDYREILQRMKGKPKAKSVVLIYGGGLVAMGLAQALTQKGYPVKVIVRSRILRRYFDPEAGALIGKGFSSQGAEILPGSEIARVVRKGKKWDVVLSDGSHLSGDLLVNCLGTTPRVSFLEGSGIAADGGILVDRRMRTSKEDIYAAGDVAVARDFFYGREGGNAILPSAVEQGRIAGSNMAGQAKDDEGWVSMNVFHFFGKGAASIGLTNGDQGVEVMKDGDSRKGWYKKLGLKEGRLVGAVFVNVDVDPGVILYLIKNRLEIEKVKAQLLKNPGQVGRWLMARNERA